MFYIMNWRCLLFFMVHLLIHNVLVQSIETREAFVGDTVILPCSINRTVVSVDVFWRDNEEKVLVDIIKSKEDFSEQSPEYRDRVQTFQTDITNGNFSIKLSNVTLSDSRNYTCNTPTSIQKVQLSVKVPRSLQSIVVYAVCRVCTNLLLIPLHVQDECFTKVFPTRFNNPVSHTAGSVYKPTKW
ncbi:myelin-oligodendrocyte glycoprotein-like isoform X2 [Tachysurus vachellii]|uniref:myelin-oligodendrocyte glycoprotein-like isoform X2 n=1 Tax=Tachysurus vachellii TaxID=175792 RepID=UPI00296B1D7E|nr:myelin-oligodendrocyte glycoprotein-like isoform X2 [Tachysurus vachellii]